MRLTMAIWWSLGLIWLVTSQAVTAEPALGEAGLRQEVTGAGLTVEAAKQNAVRAALDKLHEHLRQHEPPLVHWRPSEAFVQQHLLDGPGKDGKDITLDKLDEQAKTWVVTLKVPNDTTLVAWDRAARRRELAELRLGQALQVVAGLFVLLSVIVGYVRLDDYTHGRYTGLLRAAGALVLVLVGAGWWWSR